jgi:hypothetical protein
MPRTNAMKKLLDFLNELDKRRMSYDLEHSRFDSIMVKVFGPDEYWEIEFFVDSELEVQIFKDSPMTVIGNPKAERLTRALLKTNDDAEAEMKRWLRDASGKIRPLIPRKQARPRAGTRKAR